MTPWTELTFAAAFLVGVTGSLHCASMCAPLLGILCASREKSTSGTIRLVRATTYHAGRIASYAIGGALAGSFGSVGLALRPGPSAQHVVLFATSAMLLLLAAYIAGWRSLARAIEAAGSVVWRRIEPYSRAFLPADTPGRAFALGLAWGWLPCGMVYAALIAALMTADPLHGSLLMAAFGAGTLPSFVAVFASRSLFARAARSRWARATVAAIIGAAGLAGIARAAQTIEADWCIDIPTLTQLVNGWL